MALAQKVQEYAGAPAGVRQAKRDDLLDDGRIGLARRVMRPAGELVKAVLARLLVAVDPLVGRLPGNAEAVRQVGDRVELQLVVFEEPLSLFAHGNTPPGHGQHLPSKEVLPMS